MKRTQIYLDDKTYDYLRSESKAQRLSISEVIRQSVRDKMTRKLKTALTAVDKASGVWKNRTMDVDEYIRTARKDRKP